jgi:hypothetical protein
MRFLSRESQSAFVRQQDWQRQQRPPQFLDCLPAVTELIETIVVLTLQKSNASLTGAGPLVKTAFIA